MEIKVLKNILGANEQIAAKNRQLLDSHGIFAVNLLSSPGAGKTSLILQTIKALKGKVKIGVIEGDIAGSVDAEKVSRENVPALQINTGGQCHLDANQMNNALNNLPLADIELLFVENVGNLICTADFVLGEDRKVVISSVPEGDDKPIKYPIIFNVADAVLINKIDLIPYVNFNTQAYIKAIRAVNQKVEIFQVSCTTGQGIDAWASWLLAQMKLQTQKARK
jgi:hydrogenase nickel incorporation protein HypB